MRIVGLLLSLIMLSTISRAQVIFYSDPEPIHGLNSPDGENYIYLGSDGRLVFTREKSSANPGGKFDPGDLWFSSFDKIDSVKTRKLGALSWMQTPLGYSEENEFFLYSETSLEKGQYKGKVKTYSLSTGKHTEIEIPHFASIGEVQTGYLSTNGRVLLISMEKSSGYGVEDIYVCFLNAQGKWSAPKGLGGNINTEFQEITPFLTPDTKGLYFASNGRGGFGSFDIFYSERLDESWRNWTEPVNVGSPVNTIGAETSFMFRNGEEYAYFVSTQNSDGYGDIKRVRIEPTNYEEPEEEPIDSLVIPEDAKTVTFYTEDAKTSSKIPFSVISKSEAGLMSEPQMSYQHIFSVGDSLVLEFKSKGYLSKSIHVAYDKLEGKTSELIIKVEPLETGYTIVLENVLFHQGTDRFVETSVEELELVKEMMLENPDVKIFLKGHTDNVGNKMLNVELSQKRVIAVKRYLTEHGIAASRVSGQGYGGDVPIADNRNEETRKLNRRVEFEVIRD